MGWSVVVENGSYNWTRVISSLPQAPDPSDNTEPELSQHYQYEVEVHRDGGLFSVEQDAGLVSAEPGLGFKASRKTRTCGGQ